MNRRNVLFLLMAGLLAVFALTPLARADDEMDGLKDRFAKRLAALNDAKGKGLIGETWQGYVEVVDAKKIADADPLPKLVKEENTDRKRLYEIIAKKNSTEREPVTADQVGQRSAQRNFKQARPGEWLKDRNGWYQKKAEK